MKPSVYLETTIVSYIAAKPSKDIVILGHQQITHEWWENVKPKLNCYISSFVTQESQLGDRDAAKKRLILLEKIKLLEINSDIQNISEIYFNKLNIPGKAQLDAVHLAIACYHKMDYLLSWNCKHIVSARIRRELEKINNNLGIFTPIICTPEELMEV